MATGKTRHDRGDQQLPTPWALRIVPCQAKQVEGYYLCYDDDAGQEMTDTYHETIDTALRQARSEFGVTPREWKIVEKDWES
jgi:hypothetical protein